MFVLSESETATIRAAMERSGELGAAAELRRLYPGIKDMANARRCVRIIAGWGIANDPHEDENATARSDTVVRLPSILE